ncbi:MAG: SulP family inorganic anion transporter [Eubacteriales bacterium]
MKINISKEYTPKIVEVMKDYSKEQFGKDVVAGVIVAIIALPLSIALALASGVSPEQGLYTAIFAGFVIALFGGSRVQISGPTAAFATIVAGIVATKGIAGLATATIMAGIILVLMGICKFGYLIKFIPITIVTGFTTGIAVTIVIGQIKDFMGLTYTDTPIETIEKLEACLGALSTVNIMALVVGMISLVILIAWPKINAKIPASLIAVIAGIAIVKFGNLEVNTIGSLYVISNQLPTPSLPDMNYDLVSSLLPDAFTIAVLAAIESLLSSVVSDGMIGDRHNPNAELIAQGAGNITSALFGGIPATGAIARTAANVKNGGRSPISGMVHSIVLVLILVILMPYAALIPMPTIAAILFVVAYNMSEWREFLSLIKKAPKSDSIVLVVTFILTVVFDLVVAIELGLLLAAILLIKRMSEVTDVKEWTYDTSVNDELKSVPKGTLVYEMEGPMFFAAADKIMKVYKDKHTKVIILRMRNVPSMDMSALRQMEALLKVCKKQGIILLFSHVAEQPMRVMEKSGFVEEVGLKNYCTHIDDALARAEKFCKRSER